MIRCPLRSFWYNSSVTASVDPQLMRHRICVFTCISPALVQYFQSCMHRRFDPQRKNHYCCYRCAPWGVCSSGLQAPRPRASRSSGGLTKRSSQRLVTISDSLAQLWLIHIVGKICISRGCGGYVGCPSSPNRANFWASIRGRATYPGSFIV